MYVTTFIKVAPGLSVEGLLGKAIGGLGVADQVCVMFGVVVGVLGTHTLVLML